MEKILGLDLGTNSIGWAIIERNGNECTLLDKGVNIFQEGVAREKGAEKPAVQDRTNARASRRHYFRRRLRKIELLKILVENDMCPKLSFEQLKEWKINKQYPIEEDFLLWQRTNESENKNPYYDRYRALTETLDLTKQKERYVLGRAFYHLAQRRGFLSNRKDAQGDEESGKVKTGIKTLSQEMEEAHCSYIGEYFYQLYQKRGKIRGKYTSRNEHYLKEFYAICKKQDLSEELMLRLRSAIFFQRPLKSQKGLVGKCTFEKGKSRCPSSHPRFEEFRMLSFINNIRVADPETRDFRPLSHDEIKQIMPLFHRKSKSHFDFEDIAKKIAGKKNEYSCKGDREQKGFRFNYARTATVTGCPVTAEFISVFGDEWMANMCSQYIHADKKEGENQENEILNDVWHALFFFEDEEKLCKWATEKLQLNNEQAKTFSEIHLPQDYANLSLNAINKILPYLRMGMRYDEAVFVANLRAVLPKELWENKEKRNQIETDVLQIVEEYPENPTNREFTKEQCVKDYLRHSVGVEEKKLSHLYHPSMIETYPKAECNTQGVFQLGSPRTQSVRNPMAMRALFRLRHLINRLLQERKIDRNTKINIEFARGLNDANRRKAIEQYQRERDKKNQEYREDIRNTYREEAGKDIEPTETDILKYRLWKEQKGKCPYTGKEIRISDFLGAAPAYDIEHTIPRSKGGDNSQMNKTLCENKFNRDVKGAKLPSELHNHVDVLARLETFGWEEKIENLQKQVEMRRRDSKRATTKEQKDRAIQSRHKVQMELDYWKGKYQRFVMTEVPEGFSNRQGVDIGIIGKYARLYLKTVFDKIYTVKGATTAEFRKMWGLQDEYAKKERINHIHHCVDAVVIACIGKNEYDAWAQYMADEERFEKGNGQAPCFAKPWSTFTNDIKKLADEVLVSHYTADNMPKQSRKKLRKRGKVQVNAEGKPMYSQGDTARGVLHMQTFYGAIERDGEIKYVVRKSISQLQPSDVEKIVDDTVKQCVQAAIQEVGFKKAINPDEYTIWMNEEKQIPIRKVRIFASNVTKPISLKKQRDLSLKEYKQNYYVINDSNYCLALYEGTDAKGKSKRNFKLISNLEAAKYFRLGTDKENNPYLVPLSDKDDYPLKYVLRIGMMVLFYEDTPQELYKCSPVELGERLYKITGLSSMTLQGKYNYGVLLFKHHQEARPVGELKARNGEWKEADDYRPIIRVYHTQFKALVEGYDFEITITGEIKFKR